MSNLEMGLVPHHQACLSLQKAIQLSEKDLAGTKPYDLAGPPQAPPALTSNAPLHPQAQSDIYPWQQQSAQDDDIMSGIDVLQWFEQDFALNSGAFDETYDAMSLQPAQWQQ